MSRDHALGSGSHIPQDGFAAITGQLTLMDLGLSHLMCLDDYFAAAVIFLSGPFHLAGVLITC